MIMLMRLTRKRTMISPALEGGCWGIYIELRLPGLPAPVEGADSERGSPPRSESPNLELSIQPGLVEKRPVLRMGLQPLDIFAHSHEQWPEHSDDARHLFYEEPLYLSVRLLAVR